MRKTIQGLLLVLITAACGGTSTESVQVLPVATTAVALRNNAFDPGAITVSPGATVAFTNNDGVNHNLTFTSAAITSVGNFTTGTRQVVMPATPGTYDYHCTNHVGMTGTVQVQ
jgi:plastocyanin